MRLPLFNRRGEGRAMTAMAGVAGPPPLAADGASPAEAKASRTAALIAFDGRGRPAWTPRDYAALAREGFARNAIVYRSVRMIAEAAAAVPWLLYDGADELDDHPLLALLARPNRRQAGTEFREALCGHLLVAGNAYVEAVAVDGSVRELHALRPDRMKVVPGPDGWPEAYEYSVGGRTARYTDPGEGGLPPILQLSLFHPLNDHYGFAPIEAAQVALDIHNAAGAWNKALLDNSARPSGALVYQAKDGGNLSAEQFERLKAELETSFIGAAHADNTYSNYKEANLAFWRGTVLPLLGRIAAARGGRLGPAFGERLRLSFDADQVDALSAEREAVWARVEEATFLTVNEKRAAVGYGPVAGGDGVGEAG